MYIYNMYTYICICMYHRISWSGGDSPHTSFPASGRTIPACRGGEGADSLYQEEYRDRVRAKKANAKIFKRLLLESKGRHVALTVLHAPCSLDSGQRERVERKWTVAETLLSRHRGASPIRKCPPPKEHSRTLGTGPVSGPSGVCFILREIDL